MQPQGLAEVETYNREEGTLMRFWYPINALERPTAGLARSSSLALCSEDRTRADLYCELLRNEASMTRMYCREAHSRLLSKLAENHNQMSGKIGWVWGKVDIVWFAPRVLGCSVCLPQGYSVVPFFQVSFNDENSQFYGWWKS